MVEKNKPIMKSQHALNAPRPIEANLSISFVLVSASQPSQLETINQATLSELDIIDLSSFSLTDPRQKYRYIPMKKLTQYLMIVVIVR